MKLAKSAAKLLGVLVVAVCLVPGVWAQGTAAKNKSAHRPKAKAKAAAPAAPEAATSAEATSVKPDAAVSKRDPFVPLVNDKKQGPGNLPPGIAGLVVATVHVDGTVSSPNGMIAVVSNPEQRVYFIREGDHLYDGSVEKIGLDGVTFRETSKDAFGKPVERVVTKRIYASAGEQQ
ncbi:MAG: hypothetical protein ACRD5R_11625 [Candidatus Acidiferrales bacterium]